MTKPDDDDVFERFVEQARDVGLPTEREARGLERRLQLEDVLPKKGQRFYEFDIDGVISVGSFGIVYRARRDGEPRALKILRPDHIETPLIVKRFWREMEILRKIAHGADRPRCLPRHYSHGEVFQIPYIEMELIEGKTLSEELLESSNGCVTVRHAREVLLPISEMMADLHKRGVVHRDIKPSNIILGSESGVLRPVLVDFGVATAPDTITTLHSRSNAMVGTVGYLAPELARGEESSARSDVFSLGAVLCRCVYGRTPYQTGTEEELLTRAKRGEVDLPPEHAGVPKEIQRLIERATRPDLAWRMESARDFSRDLSAIVDLPAHKPTPLAQISAALLSWKTALTLLFAVVVSAWAANVLRIHFNHTPDDPDGGRTSFTPPEPPDAPQISARSSLPPLEPADASPSTIRDAADVTDAPVRPDARPQTPLPASWISDRALPVEPQPPPAEIDAPPPPAPLTTVSAMPEPDPPLRLSESPPPPRIYGTQTDRGPPAGLTESRFPAPVGVVH